MATKKKKAPAKKAAAKKPARKKAAVKKVVKKKSPAKKVSKPAKKKSIQKKSVRKPVKKKAPARKKVAKKSPSKKVATRKSPVKKRAAKKAPARKSKSTPSRISLLETPSLTDIAVSSASSRTLTLPKPRIEETLPEEQPKKKRKGVLLLSVVALAAIAAFAVSNSGGDTEVAEPVVSESPSPTPSETAEEVVQLLPPTNVFADYTPTGGVVTWNAPAGTVSPTGYVVEASYKSGAYVAIATLSAETFELQLMKIDTPSETVYRVIAKYPQGDAVSDTSSIKGKYEVSQP